MLFNSHVFLFAFLPVVLSIYLLFRHHHAHRLAIIWLVGASFFFYGWWDYRFLGFLLASIIFNFLLGGYLRGAGQNGLSGAAQRKAVLAIGIAVNLMLIGYFKYANFLVDTFNQIFAQNLILAEIILPLAISFFTFQQIAYLVDAYRGETEEYDFANYCLFVTFFPQLIAGPIVHHKEVMPQFEQLTKQRTDWYRHVAIGLTILTIGLFKKVVIADGIAEYATPVFEAANNGQVIDFVKGWQGALAYTMQLYFDFSGYSDMAIGLARMFGIRLPLNFNAPYRALTITEFWRRWHITLSRFLRDYVYIPLGGNRKGPRRRFINLFLTMLLGGLWHGAGWTFVVWGGLHGAYLIMNHGWHEVKRRLGIRSAIPYFPVRTFSFALTFIAVVFGWVLFRAATFSDAMSIIQGMIGLNGVVLPQAIVRAAGPFHDGLLYLGISTTAGGGMLLVKAWIWISLAFLATLLLPTTQHCMRKFDPFFGDPKQIVDNGQYCLTLAKPIASISWRPSLSWSIAVALLLFICVLSLTRVSEFLYFQF